MFDFSQVSAQSVGFAVFVGLLALRCGLLWVTGSAAVAVLAASDHVAVLSRVATAIQGLDHWLAASLGGGGW